ncbi:MAG: hypothetical protein H7Z73_06255 [Candidatus Saccharibacteria bacterium]|nr:hypothetical protein [Moraxellaceae bacterium]
MTILSTSAKEDLSLYNNEFFQFSPDWEFMPEAKYLKFDNKWLVTAEFGCSCGFRHLCGGSVELGFGEPEDWFPETASTIESTRQVIALIRAIVEKGEHVDCVDGWCNDQEEAEPLDGELDINLETIENLSFRFFENYRFNFVKQ